MDLILMGNKSKRRPGMYICTGCKWQWLYLGHKRWRGPIWYDKSTDYGIKSSHYHGGLQSQSEVKDYSNCWPRLVPLGSVTHVTSGGVAQTPGEADS